MSKNKNKKWDASKMEEAIQLVKEGMSKHEAAIKCNVPRKTLCYRIEKGQLQKPGKGSHLSDRDEEQLLKYIIFMSDAGAPVSPKWVRETAGRIASERYVTYINIYI